MNFDWWAEWRQLGAWLAWVASVWNWDVVSSIATAVAALVTAGATLIAFKALRANVLALGYLREQVVLAQRQVEIADLAAQSAANELEKASQPKIIPKVGWPDLATGSAPLSLLNAGQSHVILTLPTLALCDENGKILDTLPIQLFTNCVQLVLYDKTIAPGEERVFLALKHLPPALREKYENGYMLVAHYFNQSLDPHKQFFVSFVLQIGNWGIVEGQTRIGNAEEFHEIHSNY